ncbi:MAG: tRNA (cytidine(34)-2'-O)-methyltransferase [Bacteriovoracaceae bacterium]|nr:tRNA (cytidine(34)-2'-O)-methyltransferase [Bacteriovoracaceae bacterium]
MKNNSSDPPFKIVLYAPVIPGNTGSIGRTCVGLNAELILIKPYGFDLSEKSVRRAGLDYWKYVQLKEFDSFDHFLKVENPLPNNLFFFSKSSTSTYYQANFQRGCYLIFGSETTGLPSDLFSQYKTNFFKIPMYSDKIRSLNLANAATTVSYEALRQIDF